MNILEKIPKNHSYLNDGIIITKEDGTQETIQIPYNTTNILASENDLIKIFSQNGIKVEKIHKLNLFHEAFTHPSYIKKEIFHDKILTSTRDELGNPKDLLELRPRSYERLEYFGDRVIKLVISMYLYKRYPHEDEGFMTRLQTKLEDKKNLSAMSMKIGLGKFFIISKQIEVINGRNFEKIHEDIFEAFMGALFLSNGLEICILFLINLLETVIDYSNKLYCDNNYKDRLLRYYHQKKWNYPQYVSISSSGPSHKKTFVMGVCKHDFNKEIKKMIENKKKSGVYNYNKKEIEMIMENCIGFGSGTSKKEGEQKSAKMVLILHNILNKDQYKEEDIWYPNLDKEENEEIIESFIPSIEKEPKNYFDVTESNTMKKTTDNMSELSSETDSDY